MEAGVALDGGGDGLRRVPPRRGIRSGLARAGAGTC